MASKNKKADILFDSIDLDILETLNNSNGGMKVLELSNRLNIKPNNLKPHIDKLLILNLIFTFRKAIAYTNGKIEYDKNAEATIQTGISNFEDLVVNDFPSEKEYYEALEDVKRDKILLDFLRDVRKWKNTKEEIRSISIDLRRNKDKEDHGLPRGTWKQIGVDQEVKKLFSKKNSKK